MNLNMAPEIHRSNTAKRKFVRKMLTYLATGGNDRGERHEINTIYQAFRNSIRIGGTSYSLPDGSYFSVDKWPKYDEFSNLQLKTKLDNALGIGTASKVLAGGHHEVDLVLVSGANRLVIECKSGDAASSGAQFASYVEVLLTLSNPATPTQNYFAYCHDSDGEPSQADILGLMHKFLCVIPRISVLPVSPPLYAPAQAYLDNIGYGQNDNADPRGAISKIFEYEAVGNLPQALPAIQVGAQTLTLGGPAVGILSAWPKPEEYVNALNTVLLGRFGFGLTIFHVSKTTDDKVTQWLKQYAGELADEEKAQDLGKLAEQLLGK